MASTMPSFPGQQEAGPGAAGVLGQAGSIPQAVASTSSAGGWQNSGPIGPFFGVISVLAVLVIVSCFVGRMCTRNGEVLMMAPLGHHISGGSTECDHEGWMGRVKRILRWSFKDGNKRGIDHPVVDGEKEVVSPA